jgi:hypothetical protein
MSVDTETPRYNRQQRREMRKRGILVRYKANGDQVVCHHLEDMWCGECINFGREVDVEMPDGSISHGHIITNI